MRIHKLLKKAFTCVQNYQLANLHQERINELGRNDGKVRLRRPVQFASTKFAREFVCIMSLQASASLMNFVSFARYVLLLSASADPESS